MILASIIPGFPTRQCREKNMRRSEITLQHNCGTTLEERIAKGCVELKKMGGNNYE